MVRNATSSTTLFFAILLSVVGGFGLGFLFRSAGTPHMEAGSQSEISSAGPLVPGVPSGGRPDLIAPELADSGRSGIKKADRVKITEASLTKAVATTRSPQIEITEGDGSIRGIVQDREGQPIPGVKVLLVPPRPSLQSAKKASSADRGSKRTKTLEETLKEAADKWADSEGLARSTISDSTGQFAISNLPDENFYVRAEADGWTFQIDGPNIVRPGSHVTFEGDSMASFRVELVSSDGTPIEKGFVSMRRGGSSWMAWSQTDPLVRSTNNQVQIRAIADIYEELSVNGRTYGRLSCSYVPVDIAADGSTVVTLELEPNAILTGRLEGSRHGYNSVFAMLLREGEQFDPTLKLRGESQASGRSGVFTISGLLPGRYAVGLLGNDNKVLEHQIIELTDGINEITLQKHALDRSRCVQVRTMSPTGARVDNVSYRFEWIQDGGERDTEGIRVFRDIEGFDLVDIDNFYSFDIDEWPAGTEMWLAATSSAFGKVTVPYALGQKTAEMQFEAPCELEVKIHGDLEGTGYSVVLYDSGTDPENPNRLRSARQGSRSSADSISRSGVATFRGLSPGSVTVKLERSLGWYGKGLVIDEQSLTLTNREHQVDLRTGSLSDLAVSVLPAEDERSLRLQIADDEEEDGRRNLMWAETNEAGRAVLRGIPPGEYFLLDSKTGALLEVHVPTAEVRWDLSDYITKLTVSVRTKDGKLAEWGFQVGDFIIAMNGEPIKERKDVLDRLHESSVTLTVERGDSTVEIEIPQYPRDTRKKNPLGGRWYVDN